MGASIHAISYPAKKASLPQNEVGDHIDWPSKSRSRRDQACLVEVKVLKGTFEDAMPLEANAAHSWLVGQTSDDGFGIGRLLAIRQ